MSSRGNAGRRPTQPRNPWNLRGPDLPLKINSRGAPRKTPMKSNEWRGGGAGRGPWEMPIARAGA
eukprot:3538254-Pyramimonas_sp.AAC.1